MQRRLSSIESIFAKIDLRAQIATTMRGPVDTDLLTLALHQIGESCPIVNARLKSDENGWIFTIPDDPPPLTLNPEESLAADLDGVAGAQAPMLRASIIPGDRTTIALNLHHVICDGRSLVAVMHWLWRNYTLLTEGRPVTAPSQELPESLEERLRRVHGAAECAAYAASRAQQSTGPQLAGLPTSTPAAEGLAAGPRQRSREVQLDPHQTSRVAAVAYDAGLTENSLLGGAAMVALRRMLEPATGPLTLALRCGVDIRPRLDPPLRPEVLVYAGGHATVNAEIDEHDSAVDVGTRIQEPLMAAVMADQLTLGIAAVPEVHASALPAMPAPSIVMTNMGQLPPLNLPGNLACTRTHLGFGAFGGTPHLCVTHANDRLTIHIPFSLTWNTDEQMDALQRSLRQALDEVLST